jgi:hypothetical protein
MSASEADFVLLLSRSDKSFVCHRCFRRNVIQRHFADDLMTGVKTPQDYPQRLTFPEYVELDTQAIGLRLEFDIKSPVGYGSSITKILSGAFPIPD